MKKIIAIIPARGGSKGLPRKNIKTLVGKPLIAWTIEQAKSSRYIDKIIVSTEDQEIEEIAEKYGAEIIKRPKKLAMDKSITIDVIFQALKILKAENYNPDIIVLLQPTSPLRSVEDIDNAIKLFLNNNCKSVVSVCETSHSPYWCFKIEDEYLKPLFEEKYLRMRRQDLENIYKPNGAIYISTPQALYKYKTFYSNCIIPYIMPAERSIDIDNKIDFMLAELLIKNVKKEGIIK